MTISRGRGECWDRRRFLANVAGTSAVSCALSGGTLLADATQPSATLNSAIFLGEKFVRWQTPYGAPDPEKCPYRTPGKFDAFHMHGSGPMTRALYRLYDVTKNEKYKAAADRYALFLINALHD